MTQPKTIFRDLTALALFSSAWRSGAMPAHGAPFAVKSAQHQGATPLSEVWISPELGLGKAKTISTALKEPLEDTFDVTVGAPPRGVRKTLRTCVDYLAVEKSIYDAGPAVVSNVLYAQGARCDAFDLLRTARPATHSAFREFSFKRLSVKELPSGLALIIANEEQIKAERIAKDGGSILDMDRTVVLHAKGDDQAELVTRNWTADLILYGRADFLGNGEEQLLVRRDAAVKQGSYRSTRLYLLSRPSPSGLLRIEKIRP